MGITLFALSGALIAVSSGVMAFIMFAVGRNRLHILWGVFCISVFIWGIGGYFIGTTHDANTAFLWWRVTHIGVAFIPVLFLHFVFSFLKQKRTFILVALYILAFLFAFLALSSDLLIAHMRFVFGEFYYDSPPGLLYPLFTLYFFALTIYSHILLYLGYRREELPDSLDRIRIKYFFLGMLISFAGGSMSFLPVYGIDLYPVTNFAVIIYPIIIGYAILRHQLFDIRSAAAQGLMALLWIFVGVRMVFSTSQEEFFINGFLFVSMIILGFFLVRSINKELKSRERIEQQEQELEEANERQKNLIHFISHEIKGYLAKSEAGFAAITEGDYGEVPADLKDMATRALTETRRGVDTVMEILSAGDLKKGTISFEMQPFDLRASVEQIVAELKPSADAKHLSLETQIDGSANYAVVGDRTQFSKHVIFNLIDNAIKYTPSGAVRVSLFRRGSTLTFSVADSGVGLTSEDKGRLFTEGGRGKDSLKLNAHSTGYGLFIAKSIVDAHHGRIYAESEGAGKGSTFTVELPAKTS